MKAKSFSGEVKVPEYVSPSACSWGFVAEGVLCTSGDVEYTDNGGILGDNNWGEF